MRRFFLLLCPLTLCCAASVCDPPTTYPFFQQPLLLGAHRGGAQVWPENTVVAFQEAAQRWPDVLLEADVRVSKDGALVLMHDAMVDRTTDGQGLVAEKTLAELQALDAAYDFTPDQGATFPYRGLEIRIPTLAEALQTAPRHRFLIELKGKPEDVAPLLQAVGENSAVDRVILASFKPEIMAEVRRLNPKVLTCFDTVTGQQLLTALRNGGWADYQPAAAMLSVTTELHAQFKITKEEIAAIQGKGIVFQLHTLNTREEMEAALDAGVQSILTDDPVLLETVWKGREDAD